MPGVSISAIKRVDDLAEIVRRDVGRHADGDAGRAVDQQVGDARRQDQRLPNGVVVVGAEVDGFLVDVGQHLAGDARHADLGVAHRRRRIAVDRAEVALAVDQRVAQGEVLRHAHDGVVHRRVAVRMVLADDVADDAGRLLVRPVPVVVEVVHRVQYAAMHRLEAVARVRQGARDDDGHGVVHEGLPHLVFDRDRNSIALAAPAGVHSVASLRRWRSLTGGGQLSAVRTTNIDLPTASRSGSPAHAFPPTTTPAPTERRPRR